MFDELERRGVLDQTWIVITGDHGEGLGEHDLFEHGESLYSTEIHVPLLDCSALRHKAGRVVRETVSLRDLPATVVELAGLGTSRRFRAARCRFSGATRGAGSDRGVRGALGACKPKPE